jgi:hypothetical protein
VNLIAPAEELNRASGLRSTSEELNEVTGSNSYSKMVARYRQDLLAVHAASEAGP